MTREEIYQREIQKLLTKSSGSADLMIGVAEKKGMLAKIDKIIANAKWEGELNLAKSLGFLRNNYINSYTMPQIAKKRNMKRTVKTKGWRK